ncbi:MAG: class I SAM-dependent methyltransferase, partial [Azonexus sp.]|nr:class I SAM-dependent methyltransferase [Azonexus sp.]
FDIGGVYSPNPVVWNYLNRVLKEIAPSVRLVNDSPVDTELSAYRMARNYACALLERPLPLASDLPAKLPLAEIELAALFRHTDLIPGMCDHEKLCALYEIARHSTQGDVVEIGSWWGKSAFILARLSRCYAIGNLLCIDPWSSEHLIQNDGNGLVDSVSVQMNTEEALNVFLMNLIPYSFNHVNYLRMPSAVGVKHYRDHLSATSAAFGSTNYLGRISILHIDGNHSYASAKADVVFWHGFVIEGGWIVIDDYIWPYGDGPKRVGDEFLAENYENIVVAFVIGSALFIQLKTVGKNEV